MLVRGTAFTVTPEEKQKKGETIVEQRGARERCLRVGVGGGGGGFLRMDAEGVRGLSKGSRGLQEPSLLIYLETFNSSCRMICS